MKKLLLTLSIVTVLCAKAEAFDSDAVRTVSSQGICFTNVADDKVKINIRVSTTDKESSEVAFSKTKASYADLEAYIDGLNVPGLEIETGSVNIFEDTKWNNVTREQELVGYKAEILTNIEMPIREKEYMGVIIDKAASYTGVYLNGFSVYVSQEKIEKAKTDCLSKAVKNAKLKAEAMATAGGAMVDRLLEVSNVNSTSPRPYYLESRAVMSMAKSDAVGSAPMEINSKDQEITVEVSTVWEIK